MPIKPFDENDRLDFKFNKDKFNEAINWLKEIEDYRFIIPYKKQTKLQKVIRKYGK